MNIDTEEGGRGGEKQNRRREPGGTRVLVDGQSNFGGGSDELFLAMLKFE